MGRITIAALEHGLSRGDTPALDAHLRAITGEDELALAELPSEACLAERATALLARTMVQLGDLPGGSSELARTLTVGDRERLLLTLHAASYDPEPEFVVTCSGTGCGEQLEIAVPLHDLMRRPERSAAPEYVARISDDAGNIRFRLPTGADQEEAALMARADPERAGDLLFERCVIAVEDGAAPDRATLRALLAERMPVLDPQAETILDVACPSCGAETSTLIDAASLIFQHMASGRRLLSEIDRIARVYHWSEAEILAMPVARRRAYLDLIAEMETAP
jgi:uncharacterized tellurite resistance protein B-like protein